MKKKYVCPLCVSQLEAWQEVVYYRGGGVLNE